MSKRNKTLVLALSCLIFLALGIVTSAIGPVLPQLAENAGVNLAGIGALFTALFLGALVSQLVSGSLGDRIGQKWVLMGGAVLIAAGTFGIVLSRSLPLTLGLAFLAGLGHGAVDLGGNVLIASVFEKRSVSALNLLNVFFGVGAFLGPAGVSLSIDLWHNGLPVLWVCSALFVAVAPLLIGLRVDLGASAAPAGSQAAAPASRPVYRSLLLWALGLLILVYVGTETGMGGWTTTYMQRTTGMPIESAALVTSGFWLALTVGRMITVVLGLRLAPQRVLSITLAGAGLGGLLLALFTGSQTPTIAAVLLIGLSFGAVYPTVMAITTARFAYGQGKAVSVVAAMGSVGGMLLPWLQGVLLEQVGVHANAWFTLSGALAMLVIFSGVRLASARRAASAGIA